MHRIISYQPIKAVEITYAASHKIWFRLGVICELSNIKMKKVYFPEILTPKVNANGGKKVYFCEENSKSHFAYRSLPVNQMS